MAYQSDSPAKVLIAHDREVITPVTGLSGFEGAGYGRIIRFKKPQRLGKLLDLIMNGLGYLNALSLAVPQSVPLESRLDIPISSVGICAGSGGSMLGGLDIDMLFTGELSHHEALAAIEQGRVVVTAFHSNTERAFLRNIMQPLLGEEIENVLGMAPEVAVSQVDRDPFETVIRSRAAESNDVLNQN
jgi:putative NIF3 family GTP cyclohydrolase 1 type 2